MKRFHVHLAVTNISNSVEFYSNLFGQPPVTCKEDYAKWMLDDPRVNFAISARGHATGVNHLGMQAESPGDLTLLKTRADAASQGATLDQGEATCCYANSEKHWTIDPQGVAWEHFFTISDTETFDDETSGAASACCIPLHGPVPTDSESSVACCVTDFEGQGQVSCCK